MEFESMYALRTQVQDLRRWPTGSLSLSFSPLLTQASSCLSSFFGFISVSEDFSLSASPCTLQDATASVWQPQVPTCVSSW